MTGPDRDLPQPTGGSTPVPQPVTDRDADRTARTADGPGRPPAPGSPGSRIADSDADTTIVHRRELSGGATTGAGQADESAGGTHGSAAPAAAGAERTATSSGYSYSADPASAPPTRSYPTTGAADDDIYGTGSSSPVSNYATAPDQGTGRGGFFSQRPQSAQPELAPAKSRVLQNIGGAILGLLLTLGLVILYSILNGQGQVLFTGSTGGRFLLLGLVLIAAIPAFLAGWAPAAAWVPGALLSILGIIALFSAGFQSWLVARSNDWFKGPSVGQFVVGVALPLGLALLFAGLGSVWARRAGAHSVLARLGHR